MIKSEKPPELTPEQLRDLRIRRIKNRLKSSMHAVMQESFGGNAGRSARGRLQAGLHAWVEKDTGEIVAIGTQIKKELLENPNLSSVIFTYEAGEKDLQSGDFIDIVESHYFGPPLSKEALDLLKEVVGKNDQDKTGR